MKDIFTTLLICLIIASASFSPISLWSAAIVFS